MFASLRVTAIILIMLGSAVTASSAQQAMPSITFAAKGIQPIEERPTAPEIAFKDETGRNWGFVDFRDRVVIAVFWATWCPICFREMPKLNRLQADFDEQKLLVVALSQDREGSEKVRRYYEDRGLENLKTFIDPQSIMASVLGIRGVPTIFVIDPGGKMVGVVEGVADWNSPEIKRYLQDLLSKAMQR